MLNRLEAASEETLLTLMEKEEEGADEHRRLRLVARKEGDQAVLEFVAAMGEENLQDRIALLGERTAGAPAEQEVSLRLLRHVASSVLHQQYYDMDVVTIHVDEPTPAPARE